MYAEVCKMYINFLNLSVDILYNIYVLCKFRIFMRAFCSSKIRPKCQLYYFDFRKTCIGVLIMHQISKCKFSLLWYSLNHIFHIYLFRKINGYKITAHFGSLVFFDIFIFSRKDLILFDMKIYIDKSTYIFLCKIVL